MDQPSLFSAALGLQHPWHVVGVRFDEKKGELGIAIDFEPGARFGCPECQRRCPVHDTKRTTWRHLDFFQHKTILSSRHPRTKCPEHGVMKVMAPWARSGTGFTFLFEAMVLAMVPHMPVAAIACHVDEHDTRIWRIVEHYVEDGRGRADHSNVTTIGLDETGQRKHHTYIAIFMDLDERRVLFATPGRKAESVKEFRKDLEAHGGRAENVEVASIDMSAAFILGVQNEFPDASITFDRFHILKLVNDALDKTRRQERKRYIGLKRSRYLWLRNPDALDAEQIKQIEALSQEFPDTALAYQLKLSLLGFWNEKPRKAKKRLKAWITWARNTELQEFHRVADTFEKHFDGILAWHKTHITNGILEGINSLVQAAKAKARGYSNPKTMINMTYLIAGRLPMALPN